MGWSVGGVAAATVIGTSVTAIAVLVGWTHISARAEIAALARQNVETSAVRAVEAAAGLVAPAEAAALQIRTMIEGGIVDPGDEARLERALFEAVRSRPELAAAYIGRADGSFLFVRRLGAEAFETKRIAAQGAGAVFVRRAADFSPRDEIADPADRFDPRARDWYRNAIAGDGLSWTAPYVFFTSRTPGLTVAAVVRNGAGEPAGVVGIDIELGALSRFLQRLTLRIGGSAFIMTADETVIAHSEAGRVVRPGPDQGSLRLARAADLDPGSAAVARRVAAGIGQGGSLDTPMVWSEDEDGRRRLIASVQARAAGAPWIVTVTVPDRPGVAAALGAAYTVPFLGALLAAGAVLAGILLGAAIRRPINRLAEAARTAAAGHPDRVPQVDSGFRDLAEIGRLLAQAADRAGGEDPSPAAAPSQIGKRQPQQG